MSQIIDELKSVLSSEQAEGVLRRALILAEHTQSKLESTLFVNGKYRAHVCTQSMPQSSAAEALLKIRYFMWDDGNVTALSEIVSRADLANTLFEMQESEKSTTPHPKGLSILNTFKEYEQFIESTKIYGQGYSTIYPALGLAEEAGEVAGKIKKWIRDEGAGKMGQERREAVLKELGDVLWYVSALATDLGYTLQDVVDANVSKLSSRKERNVLGGSGDNR